MGISASFISSARKTSLATTFTFSMHKKNILMSRPFKIVIKVRLKLDIKKFVLNHISTGLQKSAMCVRFV